MTSEQQQNQPQWSAEPPQATVTPPTCPLPLKGVKEQQPRLPLPDSPPATYLLQLDHLLVEGGEGGPPPAPPRGSPRICFSHSHGGVHEGAKVGHQAVHNYHVGCGGRRGGGFRGGFGDGDGDGEGGGHRDGGGRR